MREWTYEGFKNLMASLKTQLPMFELPKLSIGRITSRLPIIQGGMGVGISLSGLSSSVANNGGIGVIAANGIGMIEPDYFKDGRAANLRALKKEIRKARKQTTGPIGVNIMVALQDFHQLLETAIDEQVDMVFLGAGLPIKNLPVAKMREAGVQAIPIVSSMRAANLIFSMWKRIYQDIPDAVVVEGPKAGGHLGVAQEDLEGEAFSLETVVPHVKQALLPFEQEFGKAIPVIAAGGIFTGGDLYRAMKYGASGVQMGTRFAATDECDADIRFKEAIVASKKEDIGIIKSPVGLPGRAIINSFLSKASVKKRSFTCPWQCLAGCQAEESHYCISVALNNARKGNLDHGFVFVGTNAYRVSSIVPVARLMAELKEQYAKALFADWKQYISETAERLSHLKDGYKAKEQVFHSLEESYVTTLSKTASEHAANSLETLKREIRKTSAQLSDIQLSIMDAVYALRNKLKPFIL
ncbi:MAG: NAD(P)H-dependent flavin oxidoreductase [Spirochaetota bacterium]